MSGCVIIKEDKIVATVNGEKITETQFNYMLQTVKQQMESEASADNITDLWDTEIEGESAVEVAKNKALEAAVKNKIELLKAKEMGLELDSEDKTNISMQKKSLMNNAGGREGYNKHLKEMGFTEKSFTEFLESLILSHKLFTKITEEGDEYNVSEEDIENYYTENKEDYKEADKVRAKHILISIMDEEQQLLPEEEQEQAKQKVEEIYEQIKSGADFDKLMQEHSEDPGLETNEDGYTFGAGEMVPEFEEAAFALEPGQVSEIVESDFGYHIIKLEEKIKGEYMSLDNEQLKDGLKNMIIRERYDETIETWKKDTEIITNNDVLKNLKVKDD